MMVREMDLVAMLARIREISDQLRALEQELGRFCLVLPALAKANGFVSELEQEIQAKLRVSES
jgi:hypothetical protein